MLRPSFLRSLGIVIVATDAVGEAVPIDGFQEGYTFAVDDLVPVEPGKGWLLTIRRR